MRISGGQFRGRQIAAPKGLDVRPATDKVRQAVFNSLLSRIDIEDVRVLDGFCGSGSYGLEALSRGAGHCTFIDKNKKSIEACRQNIQTLELEDNTDLLFQDILKLKDASEPVELLFLDPPYRQELLLPALDHLKKTNWVSGNTLCVLESEKELDLEFGESKIYGDVKITYTAL